MTCIVGVIEGGNIYMGGDSAGVAGNYRIQARKDLKVFRYTDESNNQFLLGFCGSFRLGQLLMTSLEFPRLDGYIPFEYMVTQFVPAVKTLMSENGVERKKEEVVSLNNSSFLVGIKDNKGDCYLFEVQDDYQVVELIVPYASCGCGADLALGALNILWGTDIEADVIVEQALLTAEKFNAGVRRPFNIIST